MSAKARELRTALRRPSVPTAILLVLCGIAVGVAVGVIGPASAKQAPATTVTAARGTVQKTVTGSGSLEAASTANLNFQTNGTISRVYVHAGEHVQKGQLLATLDDTDARASVSEAQANLDSAQASLHSAKVGSTSTTQSTSSGPTASGTGSSGSTESPAAKAANIASAEANLESAQVALDNAESTLEQTKLRATMDGLVASVSGEAGQAVTAGTNLDTSSSGGGTSGATGGTSGTSAGASASGTGGSSTSSSSGSTSSSSSSSTSAVVVLENLDQMKLSVDFSEADIADIKVGKPASVTVSALGDRQFAAKVTEIGLVSSSSNGVVSYPVTLVLTQDSSQLKPGMTGSAKIVVAQADGVIGIPSSALTGNSVKVEQNGESVTKQVTTGLVGDSTTEITSGLAAGDKVAIQTQSALGGAGGASGLPSGGPPGGLSGGIGGGGGPPGGFPGG